MKILTKYSLMLWGMIFGIETIFILFFLAVARSFGNSSLIEALLLLVGVFTASLIVCAIIILGSPLAREILSTYRQLLKLENLSHPLLMQLSQKAPGTFHHSLIVSNLANKAAKSIGADSLLIRVAGFYHDIGKLKNPAYFVENQQNLNAHEALNNPQKSAQIIIEHVGEGIKLAKEYHFPADLLAAIKEHHGTTLVSFFYKAAIKRNLKVNEEKYRYPGPKPLSVEAALLMLADAIEARTRLEKQLSPYKIRQIITESINEKLEENQLNLSGLSESDLDKIERSFEENLKVVYHQRIVYPRR